VSILSTGAPPESRGKIAARKLRQGDMVRFATGGGGGFGPAMERDLQDVQADVRNELFTIDQAQHIYGAVLNRQTLQVDREATAVLREKRNRLRNSLAHS
jgi:N-methylhydantoinase B